MLTLGKSVTHLRGRFFFSKSSGTFLSKMSPIQPVVFCGPSGVGKSTLLKKLMSEFPNCFAFSISHTTRSPRPGEVNGKDYYFVTKEEMKNDISKNKFVEYVENYGNYYGTSIQAIRNISDSGKICILDIDTNGVVSVRKTDLNPKVIFIKPPCYEELEKRLVRRGTENEESLAKRLELAKKELAFGEKEEIFDLVIVNDNLDEAYFKLKLFLKD